ncbi:hypothetical protein GA0071312_0263 [Saliniramus fredricksonii]|uniref:Uncharacterized protein n=2 Tax=Saliniramus fredricksonii TaxID=1653334 RepID=A0ABY0K4F0_9HYPH|nr:hypothetical protein GA0071312_0263 [Saliniramus fredricksonii]
MRSRQVHPQHRTPRCDRFRRDKQRLPLARGCALGDPVAMLLNLFHTLRSAGVPVSLREHLALIEAMSHDLAEKRVEDFYFFFARAAHGDRRASSPSMWLS